MAFQIKETIEENLKLCSINDSGNLTSCGAVIIKQLPNGETYEHLGYFHILSRELRLPYEKLLQRFKEHHKALLEKEARV